MILALRVSSRPRGPSRSNCALVAFLAAVALCGLLPQAARADELQDVAKLVAAGKYDDAERRADAYLKDHPKEAQMRFLKGVVQSQRGQRDAAIATFTALTQDYPELPEPYNNLAVIYAAQARYDEARSALETAIRVSPNDATAYENLGDIYAALAARSYRDARRYDPKNTSSTRKLDAVRALLITPTGALAAAPAPVPATVAVATPAPTSAVPQQRSQRNIGLPYPAGPASATLGGTLAEAPTIVVPSETTTVPQGSAVVAIESPSADPQSATGTLSGTTTAIGADPSRAVADVTASVQRWAAMNALTTSTPSVRVDGDTAVARFSSRNRGVTSTAAVNRALTLRRAGDAWNVTDERVE